MPPSIHVTETGTGPRVLLVHGSVQHGEALWRAQLPLASRWRLVIPSRRGYVPNPPEAREDFAVDAGDIAALLGEGAHLVGHSYGGVVSLLAAGLRPDRVWSLTVSEPPAFGVARGRPEVEDFIAGHADIWAEGPRDPAQFLQSFLAHVGANATLRNPLSPALAQHARLLMVERPPWEADIPLEALRAAPFPKLVISGAHSQAFDLVCDALEHGLGARRAVLAGAGHGIPGHGDRFNALLESFLLAAEALGTGHRTSSI